MMGGSRVLVVGLVTRDHLVFLDSAGSSVELYSGYGGVLHAVAACARNGVPVALVSHLDAAAASAVQTSIDGGLVDLSATILSGNAPPRVSLFWAPDALEPVEQTVTNGASIPDDHLLSVVRQQDASCLYANFTVGHDLDRAARLRRPLRTASRSTSTLTCSYTRWTQSALGFWTRRTTG